MRSFFTRSVFVGMMLVATAGGVTGCASKQDAGKPMPELTFQNMPPFPVRVAEIDIENQYSSSADPRDVSSTFPTPPDIVLRRYAENRLKASAADGSVLKFVIEDVHIYHTPIEPDGSVSRWMGINRTDKYDVDMKIRMYRVDVNGSESDHAILNMRRSVTIPDAYTLAEKENEKVLFLELLIDDVDKAVTQTLRQKMQLAGTVDPIPLASLLLSPEVR